MDVTQQLAVEVFQIARRWRALLDERLRPAGMTKAAWAVLYWISRNPDGMTQRELAEKVGIETSTLTRQLDAMESQSLIERRAVPGDRRAKRVRLTGQATAMMQQLAEITDSVRAELFEGVPLDEVERAVDLLRRLHARLV
jgi:MarR family transcriptional regulator for hemolysin